MHHISFYKKNKTPVIIAGVLFFLLMRGMAIAQDASKTSELLQRIHYLLDANGRIFVNPYIDVAGNPFFLEDWKPGKIKVKDTVFTNIRVRLNLLSQEVHFLRLTDNIEMVAPAGTVGEITLIDSTRNPPSVNIFQCGFPAIDNQNEKNFYQLICDGRIRFLEAMRKTIYQTKDDMSGETRKEFREYDDYYFFLPGVSGLQRMRKDKESVTALMKDKNSQVEAFLKNNKISFKSIDDIKKLVDYYNSL
jgi:hypothetical protein